MNLDYLEKITIWRMCIMTNLEMVSQYAVFSDNIKAYRKERGFTQEVLAEKSELSISYIKQIESCKEYKNLTLTSILKLSKALEVPVNQLFHKR